MSAVISLAFDAVAALPAIDTMEDEALDGLEFGVIGIDAAGLVRRYNALESRMAGLGAGRVLAVTGLAPTVADAAAKSRAAAERIRFAGRTFRRDIGWREIERTEAARA